MKEDLLEQLELRMYFFVPYQLTGIQQGIQCGHAALEYANMCQNDKVYKKFITKWKTWVILNGGTTNSKLDENNIPYGSLNQIINALRENEVNFSYFTEPDLQDAVTSICFILDERVFNKKKYPNYSNLVLASLDDVPNPKLYSKIDRCFYTMNYDKWLAFIGGETNLFLRNLIEGKRLA